jgi:tricorn protease
MVCLINELTGSDGDIFAYGFKTLNLGKLIGKRTWGGVIGIKPRHQLVDRTTTTQPEYAYWFDTVGWGIENYGVAPDLDINIRPQDYIETIDVQLKEAIEYLLREVSANSPKYPKFDKCSNDDLSKM